MLESESDLKEKTPSNEVSEPHNEEYKRLRSLMLGPDYEKIITARLENDNIYRVSSVLTEAFKKRNSEDDSLAREMSPVIESAIDNSIKNHPERITNVIFPIIGPAVRKAVTSALADLMQSLNYLLQNNLSVRSLIWRVKAWRLGVTYGEYLLTQSIQYRVEQVFFIHRKSGVLIQSVQADGISYQDPDLVSSMLSAISDFAKDSFEQEDAGLETLQMGDLTILAEAGPHAVLALAVRGILHNDVKQVSANLIEILHANFAKELRYFDGNTVAFASTKPLLEKALIKQKKTKQDSKPWFAIIAVSIGLLIIGYFGFENYWTKQKIAKTIERVNQESGYQVLSSRFQSNTLTLDVLKSALAISPQELIESINLQKIEIKFNEKLASVDDPEIYLPFLGLKYNASLTIERTENKNRLVISGNITKANLIALENDSFVNSFFELKKDQNLSVKPGLSFTEANRKQFISLVQKINSQFYYFQVASEVLTSNSHTLLNSNIIDIKRALELQQIAGVSVIQIGIYGFADSQGTKITNIELSRKRAKLIKSILLENQIEKDLVISWGGGAIDNSSIPSHMQRRARIEILYTLDGVASND